MLEISNGFLINYGISTTYTDTYFPLGYNSCVAMACVGLGNFAQSINLISVNLNYHQACCWDTARTYTVIYTYTACGY